ncbi:Uncharacterised protein [Mycobacteroides abscessus subsp. abscessus]|nr:Uncharacterised protein [Mycobacteroides abscessus subsp. abscessus]
MASPTHARSSTTVEVSAIETVPDGASGRGRSTLTGIPLRRNSSDVRFASSRVCEGLRQLVSNSSRSEGLPSERGKSAVKRGRFAADAPRQP